MFWLYVSLLLLLLYALLIFYYWRAWRGLEDQELGPVRHQRFLTVIIPARNEEKTISNLLHALAQQTYPKNSFEIIVVDDFSTDCTAEIVHNFSLPNLILIRLQVDAVSSS